IPSLLVEQIVCGRFTEACGLATVYRSNGLDDIFPCYSVGYLQEGTQNACPDKVVYRAEVSFNPLKLFIADPKKPHVTCIQILGQRPDGNGDRLRLSEKVHEVPCTPFGVRP